MRIKGTKTYKYYYLLEKQDSFDKYLSCRKKIGLQIRLQISIGMNHLSGLITQTLQQLEICQWLMHGTVNFFEYSCNTIYKN